MKRFSFVLILVAALFLASCAHTGVAPSSDLKVTRVVLYQNGVGYFERTGELDKDAVTINVRHDQINDILKSLAVIDLSEGRAINVSLPVEKGAAERLAALPPQVKHASGLLDVLKVFRGATVTAHGWSRVTGRVLGVERYGDSESSNETWRATLLKDDGTLVTMPVADITALTIRDNNLEVGLKKSLDISLEEGLWKPVALTIRFTHAKKHKLMLSYIAEMPRWKPSYRIVTTDDGKVILQGWAVVDNVSGENWDNVNMSLVTGSPFSFRYNLHTPQFIHRQDLTPRGMQAAVAPPSELGGFAVEKQMSAPKKERKRSSRSRAKMDSYDMDEYAEEEALAEAGAPSGFGDWGTVEQMDYNQMADQVESNTTGEQVGSLFRYDVQGGVTVRDNSSTMVAIINTKVPGHDVWLFKPEESHNAAEMTPMKAVHITNDSEYTLEKGPVALYTGGTFVGEGFLERQEKGATTFIPYAMDNKVQLAIEASMEEEVVGLLRIVDGMILAQMKHVSKGVYTIKNRHEESGTAIVKQSKRRGWSLKDMPTGTIETTEAYYLPVEVPKTGSADLTVRFERPSKMRITIDSDLSTTVLKLYLGSSEIPEHLKKPVQELLGIKQEIGDLQDKRQALYKSKRQHENDQYRMRENLNMLRKTRGNKDLVQELAGKLIKLERKIGSLSGDIIRIDEKVVALKARLKVLIRNITLEPKEK